MKSNALNISCWSWWGWTLNSLTMLLYFVSAPLSSLLHLICSPSSVCFVLFSLHHHPLFLLSPPSSLCSKLQIQTEMDSAYFLEMLAGNFMDVVQYNEDNREFEVRLGKNRFHRGGYYRFWIFYHPEWWHILHSSSAKGDLGSWDWK